LPRYAYTIGLQGTVGFELIIPGASYYTGKQVHHIANAFGAALREDSALSSLEISPIGSFALRFAHDSWVRPLALGMLDFYGVDTVLAAQIVPDEEHLTIDVPDMAREWNPSQEPVWQWLGQPWGYPVSPRSVTTTNLAALQGSPITELARWEDTEWEMFAGPGPDVAPSDVRVVPLGTLIGNDRSLTVALEAGIGNGYWRESAGSDWHEWRRRSQ
jgi:hypothetical protein